MAALVIAALARLWLEAGAAPDSPWTAEQDRLATASFSPDSAITLHNVRDWTYADGAVISRGWTDVTVRPPAVVRAWFLAEPFSRWKAMGHTFLSFELSDGSALSFSVEARMRSGQGYSAWRGAFGAYPLTYQWGTERDFVTRRLLYLHDRVRLYPLAVPPEEAQALFEALLDETNALARKPRRYNTLTANCTNTLAFIVNRHAPRTLPWSPAWYLPGYAEAYLIRQGFIVADGRAIEAVRARHDLKAHLADIRAIAQAPTAAFSRDLRAIAGAESP